MATQVETKSNATEVEANKSAEGVKDHGETVLTGSVNHDRLFVNRTGTIGHNGKYYDVSLDGYVGGSTTDREA